MNLLSSSKGSEAYGDDLVLTEPCPVPRDQQPVVELDQLKNSFLFDWPLLPLPDFSLRLLAPFSAFFLTLGLPISLLTFSMESEAVQCLSSATAGSMFVVIILVLRMFVGYSHVGNRLLSATVEYEESGWYDGQIWVKTPQMLMRDRLLGSYTVKPTIVRLKSTLLGLSGVLASSMVLLAASPPSHLYSETYLASVGGDSPGAPGLSSSSSSSLGSYSEDTARLYEPDVDMD
ncbi:MAG: hypothetical protein WDW38_002123 [Sanguina aurantia]